MYRFQPRLLLVLASALVAGGGSAWAQEYDEATGQIYYKEANADGGENRYDGTTGDQIAFGDQQSLLNKSGDPSTTPPGQAPANGQDPMAALPPETQQVLQERKSAIEAQLAAQGVVLPEGGLSFDSSAGFGGDALANSSVLLQYDDWTPVIVDGQMMGLTSEKGQMSTWSPWASPATDASGQQTIANNPIGNSNPSGEVYGPPCPPHICPVETPEPTPEEMQAQNEQAANTAIEDAVAGEASSDQVVEALDNFYNNPAGSDKGAGSSAEGGPSYTTDGGSSPGVGDLAFGGGDSGPFGGTSMRITPAAADAMAGKDVTKDVFNANPELFAQSAIKQRQASYDFDAKSLFASGDGVTVAQTPGQVHAALRPVQDILNKITAPTANDDDDPYAKGMAAWGGNVMGRQVAQTCERTKTLNGVSRAEKTRGNCG